MRAQLLRALTAAIATVTVLASSAQVGHPAKGAWSGYWGPSEAAKRRMLLVLDWRDRALTGTINPGPNAVKVDKAALDVDTWTLTLEATMPTGKGSTARFVSTGKLDNLGSWTNRIYSGTYQFGAEHGTFKLALN
jgi:hypothetical protein